MICKIARFQKIPIIGSVFRLLLIIIGVHIPKSVTLGKNILFPHNSVGTVIHPYTTIKDNVKIYQNVTLGRADVYLDYSESKMKEIVVEEGAIICAGAKVLCKEGTLVIGKNSIVAANAVLLSSTKENEVWGGNPARKLGMRKKVS
ncbi:hypothetical protein [Clostridium sp. YIM B02551]|uniref:hypothetical protein n=1 Tax=Clostridium sp. YIM B02551 TaxID=2910679 RepID=UPI001EEB23F5|nr:hypothetical protein [Clostridium sp. YIM B02551]